MGAIFKEDSDSGQRKYLKRYWFLNQNQVEKNLKKFIFSVGI